jgi:hypothetical protein
MKRSASGVALVVSAVVASPGLAQAMPDAVRPPGDAWALVRSWCAGPDPMPALCRPDQPGQHWLWFRSSGKQGAIHYYQTEVTFPGWQSRPQFPPLTTAVNCREWVARNLGGPGLPADPSWAPILPGSVGETVARQICSP